MLTSRSAETCPHGQRGTTICLYCRQEARDLARRSRNRMLARFGLTAAGAGVAIALIVGGLVTLAPDANSDSLPATERVSDAPVGSTPAATAASPSRAGAIAPIVPEGRKDLGDSVVAERSGNDVIVHFDTELLRTRVDWKFEGVVRGTLPLVFGEPARVALELVPRGELVRGGNIVGQLRERGIRLRLASDSAALVIRPIVRQGRDGPLVVGYRATVDP